MTIIDRVHTRPTDKFPFRFAAGAPSPRRTYSHDELAHLEADLLRTVRTYLVALARHCHTDGPLAYADYVADLTEPDPGETPTIWSARLPALLHMYADYVPAAGCEFLDLSTDLHHGWQSETGVVVVDVVTTFQMTELDGYADQYLVFEATRNATREFGSRFAGVRYIVLDAPYESTWYPVGSHSQPLHACDINPSFIEAGEVA